MNERSNKQTNKPKQKMEKQTKSKDTREQNSADL